jgi:alkylated DNA repair dioxygenase AlkB
MDQLNFFGDIGEPKNISTDIFDYIPSLFSKEESAFFLQKIIAETKWEQRSQMMYGKEVITPRLTAWYGDGVDYPVSGSKPKPAPWTKELLSIKEKVEALAGVTFDSVLLNYYCDGSDSVTWQDDMDRLPGKNMIVASVSFRQERMFDIRRKDDHKNKISIPLEDGSYILMKGDLQQKWEHRIAKSTKPMKARVNLTFRVLMR